MNFDNKQKEFENLYSRQIGTYGMETIQKLVKLKIFIQGMRGVGFEIAKNLILAGPSKVTIRDNKTVNINDLGTNFYLKEDHIGRISRAKAIYKELQKLNPNTDVDYTNSELNTNLISKYDVVVITDYLNEKIIIELNEFCRNHKPNIGFILCGNLGLYCYSFIDFGKNHIINDKNGENCLINLVSSISNEKEGLVTIDKRHDLNDNDHVIFKEVKGMEEINQIKYQIKVKSPYTFSIGDTSNFKKYERDGICEQIKVPEEMEFNSLKEILNDSEKLGELINPDLDFDYLEKPNDLYLIFKLLIKFYTLNNRFPGLNFNDKNKWNEIIFKDKLRENLKEDDKQKNLLNCVSKFSDCEFAPLTSFLGGVICQEIVKKTGKYTPLKNFFFFDLYDKLDISKEENFEIKPEKNGYLCKLFGDNISEKLAKIRTFLVGTGALGCEYLKLFSLLGFSSFDNSSCIFATDDDFIEVSNLNRQFLFRRKNVGQSKSITASNVIKKYNHKINIKSFSLKVSEENEKIFTDNFFDSLDFVVNAVDNINARKYVDQKCILHNKYLFESGTWGTKCNSQIIIPFKTESYSDSVDPEEKNIPLCTLKLYPYLLDHTIEWSRDFFQSNIVDLSIFLEEFIKNKSFFLFKVKNDIQKVNNLNEIREKLVNLKNILNLLKNPNDEVIITYIRQLFENIFNNQIHELIYNIPVDHKDEKGNFFWTSPKRPPQIINFDIKDLQHSNFILSYYTILKEMLFNEINYKINEDKKDNLLDLAKISKVSNYVPKKKELDKNNEIKNDLDDDKEVVDEIIKELTDFDNEIIKNNINIIEFEKDNDDNGHIDLITSISNLRARNYKINEGTRLNIKIIAGKILPAIASTTAMVVGAVGIEIIKKVLNMESNKFRNLFSNLALPFIIFSEPLGPVIKKDQKYSEITLGPVITFPKNWDTWTILKISNCIKIKEIIEKIDKNYKINVTSIMFQNNKTIYDEDSKIYSKTKDEKIIDHYLLHFPNFYYSKKKYLKLFINGENSKKEDWDIASVIIELI